jgi:hypothetical protein
MVYAYPLFKRQIKKILTFKRYINQLLCYFVF